MLSPATPEYFVATGPHGSTENNTETSWSDNRIFSGHTTVQLDNYEGVNHWHCSSERISH
jgi:hypothetical protein